MSDTNRVRVAIARSSANAIPIPDFAAPVGAQSLRQIRLTGTPNLQNAPQTILSNEIRPDAEVDDLIQTGVEAGGDIGFEQSYGAMDDFLEALFSSTFSTVEISAISAGAAAVLTIGAAGNWADNMIARVEGMTSGDGVYLINSGGGTTSLTMANLDGSGTPDFSGTGTLKIAGVRIASAAADLSVAGNIGTLTTGQNLALAVFGEQSPGDWVEVSASPGGAFDNAGNQGLFRIIGVTGTGVSIDMASGVTEDFDEDIDVMIGERIRKGQTSIANSSLLIERAFVDQENAGVPGRYSRELFVGMAVGTFVENLTPAAIATATATMTGLRAFARSQNLSSELYANADLQALTAAAVGGVAAGLTTVGNNQVYNTASSIARIGRGSTNLVDPSNSNNLVNELTVTVNRNLRRRLAVGRFGTASIGAGEFNVSGTLGTFFDDLSILQDVLTDGFRTAINYALRSGAGRAILTDMPRCAFSAGAPDVAGKNQDVTMAVGFQALRDPVLNYTMHKTRFEYLAISQ